MKSSLPVEKFKYFNLKQLKKTNYHFILLMMLSAFFNGLNAANASPKNKKQKDSKKASSHIQNQLSPFQKIANTPNSDPNINPISEKQKEKINSQLDESNLFIENKGQFNAPGETNPILFQCDAEGYRIAISKKGLHYYFLKNEKVTDEINKIQPVVTNPLSNNTLTATKEMGSNNTDAFSDFDPSKKLKNAEIKTTAYRVDVALLNSSSPKKITKENPGSVYYNHYFGNNEFAQVRGYQKIRMHEVYPGIDWIIYIQEGKVKYDFEITQNHVSLKSLQLEFKGASDMTILPNGNLKISTPLGEIIEEKPVSFQGSKEISTEFVLNQNTIGFKLNAEIDPTQPLIIDPCVKWARYFGGTSTDDNIHIDLDNSGNIYIAGRTYSSNMATTGAHQSTLNSTSDAFLAKFNSSANLLWCTYIGGGLTEIINDCVVDKSSDLIYIVGRTTSSNNIGTFNTHKTSYAGGWDGFIVQFSYSGSRNWGSYFGGSSSDGIQTAAIDKNGNVVIGGYTNSSSDISTNGSSINGTDGFLSKFNSSGSRIWSTYIGGNSTDEVRGITTGSNNEIYITGATYSTNNISTTATHQTDLKGNQECFVMRFTTAGARTWGTYFGGSNNDIGNAIHCSADGSILVVGQTLSIYDIASASSYQTKHSNSNYWDVFLLKLNASAGTRSWSTYIGGAIHDYSYAVTSDASNRIYVAIYTENAGFGTTGAHQTTFGGSSDVCLFRFSSAGTFQWATYYGGTYTEFPSSIVSDANGSIFVAGYTSSSDAISYGFGSSNTKTGAEDAFIAKFQDGAELIAPKTMVNACPFAPVTLTSSKTGSSYAWNTSATTSSITVKNAATYKVTTTTSLGCKFTDSFSVKRYILDTTANISQNSFFCQSGQSTVLKFNYKLPVYDFTWKDASWSTLSYGQNIVVNQAGTYHMIVRYSPTQCYDTLTYTLKQQVFNVTIPKTASITCGGSYGVEIAHNALGTSPPTYSWSPTTNLTTSSTGRALLYPTVNTKYILTSSIGGNCTTHDTIDLTVVNGTAPKIQRTNDSIQCYGNTYFGFNPQFNTSSNSNRFSKLSPVTMYPALPDLNDTITIVYNANYGNAKLKSATSIYIYTGMITNLSETDVDWKHVRGNFTTAEAQYKMTSLGGGLWKITLPIKAFYGKTQPFIDGEVARKLAFVFHNASGSIKGAGVGDQDIFYPMYNPIDINNYDNQIQAIVPYAGNDRRYVVEHGETVPIFIATGEKMDILRLTVGNIVREVYNTDTVSLFYKATAPVNVIVFAYKNSAPTYNVNHVALLVNVVNLSTSNTYKWDYGDGNTANSYNLNPVYKSYSDAGTYTVKMDVTSGNGCTYTQSQTKVVVRPKAVAVLWLPSTPYCLNEDFKPEGLGSYVQGGNGSLNYFWDFGDGTKSFAMNPTNKYPTDGDYKLTLKVTGTNICADSTFKYISIRPQPPVNIISASPYGCSNGTSLQATPGFFNYKWNTGQINSTIYAYSAGTYSVNAYTEYGCSANNSITLKEHPGIQITSDNGFTLCNPKDTINLQTTSGFTSYKWSTGSNSPYIKVTKPGNYKVTAYDGTCQLTKTISIEDGSTINPSIVYTPIDPMTCVFSPKSNQGEYYSWTFGDGNVSILKSPEHTYKKEGAYLVCLDIMNRCKVRNSFCGTVYVPFAVSGTQEIQKSELNIHPNPGKGTYWIELPNLGSAASISVTDMKGAVVFYKEKFDVHEPIKIECANGMYLIKVQTNNQVFTGKINHFNN